MSNWEERTQPAPRRERLLTVGADPNTAYVRLVYGRDADPLCVHVHSSRCNLCLSYKPITVCEEIDNAIDQLQRLRQAVLHAEEDDDAERES